MEREGLACFWLLLVAFSVSSEGGSRSSTFFDFRFSVLVFLLTS